MASIFRNWHKSTGKSTKKNLSTQFPIEITGTKKNITIRFDDSEGKRIVFSLDDGDTELFWNQLKNVINNEWLNTNP